MSSRDTCSNFNGLFDYVIVKEAHNENTIKKFNLRAIEEIVIPFECYNFSVIFCVNILK